MRNHVVSRGNARNHDVNTRIQIRPIDPASEQDVSCVARNMRQTLVEVLGQETGESMYSMDWLVQRVLWHCDASQCTGDVFVAVHDDDDDDGDGAIVGHTIVRIEREDNVDMGLISTTYVVPEHRRQSIATALLAHGESWMMSHGLAEAVTYTDQHNEKLIGLYRAHGYTMRPMPDNFVRLHRVLSSRES